MSADAKPAGVDLSVFDEAAKRHEAGIDVKVLGPDGKTPLGLTIRVAGPDSDRARRAQEHLADELIEQENFTQLKAGDATRRGIRYLAMITIGWEPAIVLDGQELAYSVENAENVYRRHKFIRDQVDRAAGNRSRFMKG